MKRRITFLICTVALQTYGFAQFVPVTAKLREYTAHVKADGTQESRTRKGVYFRAADGSSLTEWAVIRDGKCEVGEVSIIDNQRLQTLHTLGPKPPEVRRTLQKKIVPMSRAAIKPENILGHDVIEGVNCEVNPIFWAPKHVKVGEACWSSEYDLLLRQADNLPDGGSGRSIRGFSLYDMKIGTAPDPKLFEANNISLRHDAVCGSE